MQSSRVRDTLLDMPRQIGFLITILCACAAVAGQQTSPSSAFYDQRETPSDLEVTGMVRGLPHGASRFVSRAWIAGRLRVSMTMKASEDYPNMPKAGMKVSGVPLATLVGGLKVDPAASVVQAICKDGYIATYSREYIRQHRPLLILQIDGMDLGDWARKNKQYDPEPYFIGYREFVPAFHVLAHQDQPLEPSEIVGLRFDTKEHVFAEILPKTANVPEEQGYRIARQNCFRCHNTASSGGTKAGISWSELGQIARDKPEHFAAWVRNPQAADTKAEMPPNPTYDAATLNALARYFKAFAAEGQ